MYVIGTSINKDIAFGIQEMRGNAFQRPLEQLLDLLPRHEAAARKALAGDPGARGRLSEIENQIDLAFAALAVAHHDLGGALKLTDAEMSARKHENARLSVLQAEWQSLKGAALSVAAGDDATAQLVDGVSTLITDVGNTSNLILDTDLDSYYLVDSTLNILPQTQTRLSSIALQVGDWLRNGTAVSNRIQIATMAAMLRADDQDHITGDVQTSLDEDKNFYGISESLQSNMPPATARYVNANQAFLGLLDRVVSGQNLPDADSFETAGWAARQKASGFGKPPQTSSTGCSPLESDISKGSG